MLSFFLVLTIHGFCLTSSTVINNFQNMFVGSHPYNEEEGWLSNFNQTGAITTPFGGALEEYKAELNNSISKILDEYNGYKNDINTTMGQILTAMENYNAKLEAANMEFKTWKNESQAIIEATKEEHETFKNETQAKFEELQSFKNESQNLGSELKKPENKTLGPECYTYNILNESDRGISNGVSKYNCDKDDYSKQEYISPMWKGASWYRFLPPAGTILAMSPPGLYKCGSTWTGWTKGTLPTKPGSTVDIQVCFDSGSNNCRDPKPAKITNCDGYYVYYLDNAPFCHLRYCAAN